MGYRNDWRISFNTHNKAKHVKNTLVDFVTNDPSHYISPLLEEMLQSAIFYEDDCLLEMGGESWKLLVWDELMCVLDDLFDKDPEIDFASIRLGEDTNDNEIMNGTYTLIYIHREIGDTDFNHVPAVKIKPMSIVAKAVCKCDLAQLMRGDGHDVNCPEKQ